MIILEKLIAAIRSAAIYNPAVQDAPACIIWPDRDRQWEAVITRLQGELKELFILGDYAPEKQSGPAIWLRCVIAGKIEDISIPKNQIPILYLPGVSRQDLRAVESCPDHLKPLAELQYRGVFWSQLNAKDWTILAFLKSDQGGLGFDVSQDTETKRAMIIALYCLLDEEIKLLKGKRLDKDYFNTLLTGGDPIRNLLQWLDQGEVFRESREENELKAFSEICKSQLAFNPQKEGILVGAAKLATHEGPWQSAWERFCEAPRRYPNIPNQIKKCKAPVFGLFDDAKSVGGWPQWNEVQEKELQRELTALISIPPHQARVKIADLEKRHAPRRELIWAELGEAPLALALEYLAVLVETTQNSLAAGTSEDLAAGYQNQGWLADNAVIQALSLIGKTQDFEAVKTAIQTIYLPWAEESARYLQKTVSESTYPGGTSASITPVSCKSGECVLFVDGLRFDIAKRLIGKIQNIGCEVQEKTIWAPLPSVTATGKAAVSPVKDKISGADANQDFEPCIFGTGQSLKGGYQLKKLLKDNGWQILERSENGDGQGKAWCEIGDIDHEGHDRGWKLAKHIESLLGEISDRVETLLAAGWKTVRIVTDHGWLLLPGGLPKIDLPSALAENKWGRCAIIKPGATLDEGLYPWFWNPNQFFALADGISCFRKGEEYAHGGLSLQECLILELLVSKNKSTTADSELEITDVIWNGLRCKVAVDGNFAGLIVDIRTQPGDPSSSIVMHAKPIQENGIGSVVIENENLEDSKAIIVIVDNAGTLMAQVETIIGGEE